MSTATAEITNNSQESGLSRSDASNGLIKSACAWAAASTLIPLSGADIAALAAVQANLVINISSLYGEKVEKYAVSGVIATLLGTLLPAYAATYAAAYAAVASTQKEPIKQEQMNLLRALIVENLSEEERECWLLVASF